MTVYPWSIIVQHQSAVVELSLDNLHELEAPAWGAICRMLQKDGINDALTHFLREWFPEAIEAAKKECATAEKRFLWEHRSTRAIRDEQEKLRIKAHNQELQQAVKQAIRKRTRLIMFKAKFDNTTKGVE